MRDGMAGGLEDEGACLLVEGACLVVEGGWLQNWRFVIAE